MTIKTNKRNIAWTIFFCTQCGFEQRSIFGVQKVENFFKNLVYYLVLYNFLVWVSLSILCRKKTFLTSPISNGKRSRSDLIVPCGRSKRR